MRLLLVEDEHRLAELLARGLREEGFAVDAVPSAGEARERAVETDYDLVLLDWVLPDGSGVDLLRAWRSEGMSTPVLMLTARDLLAEKVEGLGAGADDYLTKPFAFEELLARVRALLRRRATPPRRVLVVGGLRLDREAHQVELDHRPLELSPREFALLELLMLNVGLVLSRARIAEGAWDATYEARSNTIDVIVARLRRKLEEGSSERWIHAEPGIGYVLRPPPRTEQP